MPWLIIKAVPPVAVPIQRLSIHWGVPWDHEGFSRMQLERARQDDPQVDEETYFSKECFVDELGFGHEPNYKRSMRINIDGEDVRVFPHEYNILPPDRMRLYVLGEDCVNGTPSHDLVPNREADVALLRAALDTDLRDIYDAAQVDGCNPAMAYSVALGIDIEDTAVEFPPYGWYRLRPEYAEFFGIE